MVAVHLLTPLRECTAEDVGGGERDCPEVPKRCMMSKYSISFSRMTLQRFQCICHHQSAASYLPTFLSFTPTMEAQTDSAEGRPLLASPQTSYEGAEEASVPVTNADQTTAEKTSPWTVLWYIVLLTGGILALIFFIKGFIDAGDVDVGLSRFHRT